MGPNFYPSKLIDAQPGGDGLSWDTAMNNIEEARAAAEDFGETCEVWVRGNGVIGSEQAIVETTHGASELHPRPSWASAGLDHLRYDLPANRDQQLGDA
ncbi:MAG: hypothetical protein GY854_32660 [Deltaproteobacteria bacterium]|nr:hypothetical protein [Deltaproteobacteria bacterium]